MSEEDMFENPYELLDKGFDKYDFAQIIILLQADRREWINQYTKSHNDYVELQQENQQLKEELDEVRDNVDYYSNVYWEKCEILDEIREHTKIGITTYQNGGSRTAMFEVFDTINEILDRMKE